MEAQKIEIDPRYNQLTLAGSQRVIEAVRQQIVDAGLEMPQNSTLETSIKVIGDPVSGYPVKKVVLRVIIEANRCDPSHTIPFKPAFLRRRASAGSIKLVNIDHP